MTFMHEKQDYKQMNSLKITWYEIFDERTSREMVMSHRDSDDITTSVTRSELASDGVYILLTASTNLRHDAHLGAMNQIYDENLNQYIRRNFKQS